MLSWMLTFFVLAVIAALFGFTGLAGTFVGIAKFLAGLFIILFVVSLLYSMITGRRPPTPMV